jgi:DNA-binding protein Fis
MTWLSYKREISDQIKKVLASKMKALDGETNKNLELDLDKVIKPLR